jgi:hypothetical protein
LICFPINLLTGIASFFRLLSRQLLKSYHDIMERRQQHKEREQVT